VQVVVLDYVRIGGFYSRDQLANQGRLNRISIAGHLQRVRCTRWVRYGDHENPISVGIQTRRFQIELHSAQVIKREAPEVRSAGRDEVLFLRRQREDGLFSELPQMRDAPAEPPCRSLQDSGYQRSSVLAGDQVPQCARTVQFAICNRRSLTAIRPQPSSKVLKIIEPIKNQPRAESRLLADQFSQRGNSAPDSGAAIEIRPDGDDPRCGIPAPNPFVLATRHRQIHCAIITAS